MCTLFPLHSACTGEFSYSCGIMSHHPKLDQVFPQSHCTNITLQGLWPSEFANVNQHVYKNQMRSRTKISNVLPHPSQKYFIETALSLGFVKRTCRTDLFLFCQSTVSLPSVYVSVSSVTVDRLCQDIRCYISILNIQRTLIKLISLCSFSYEEHTNGFTTFNSFVLHSQQAQAGSLEDI